MVLCANFAKIMIKKRPKWNSETFLSRNLPSIHTKVMAVSIQFRLISAPLVAALCLIVRHIIGATTTEVMQDNGLKFYGNTAQIAYRESHSKLVCRAASIIPSVRLAGRINSGCQAGPVSQDQVRQSEQHIQFSGLLPQAPVPCLSVSEPTLDDRKYVFHFSANR